MSENNASIIQIRMKENTLNQVENFQNRVHAPSRSDAVRRAVEIADAISHAIENGEEVIIKSKRGKEYRILIPGIN